jgi:hypothetical protein
MIYTEVTIIEFFIFVYAIMSFDELELVVYRCVLIVCMLLSAIFAILSGIEPGLQETFFRKMALLVIPYLFLVATLLFIVDVIESCIADCIARKSKQIAGIWLRIVAHLLALWLIVLIHPESNALFVPMAFAGHFLCTTFLLFEKSDDRSAFNIHF